MCTLLRQADSVLTALAICHGTSFRHSLYGCGHLSEKCRIETCKDPGSVWQSVMKNSYLLLVQGHHSSGGHRSGGAGLSKQATQA
jgi:hypothetical protein